MTFFLSVTYLYFMENRKKAWGKIFSELTQLWKLLFFLCTAYLLTCTVVGRYYTVPYKNILGSFGLFDRSGKINIDLFNNIVMFIPFSFFYIKAFKPEHPFKSAMTLSISTTLFVEISQLIGWMGNFQLADILHNIIGGFLGYCLWCIWNKIFS